MPTLGSKMTKAKIVREMIQTANVGDIETLRSWRRGDRRRWEIKGFMSLTGEVPTTTVYDYEIDDDALKALLLAIGEYHEKSLYSAADKIRIQKIRSAIWQIEEQVPLPATEPALSQFQAELNPLVVQLRTILETVGIHEPDGWLDELVSQVRRKIDGQTDAEGRRRWEEVRKALFLLNP
jgi:hypothetical protein